jgi:hypothetical protein
MEHETLIRLLGYTLEAAWTFGPAVLLGYIAWKL